MEGALGKHPRAIISFPALPSMLCRQEAKL
jgi:hypothetical protein